MTRPVQRSPVLTPSEAAVAAAHFERCGESDLPTWPALVVALGDDAGERSLGVGRHLPCVTVGIGSPGDPDLELDVLLTAAPEPPAPWVEVASPGLAADRLVAAVRRSPDAAVVLAQLLRLGIRNQSEALGAESLAYGLLQAGPAVRRRLAARGRGTPARGGDPLLVERNGDVLDIMLNRPDVHNAFNAAMRDALVDALSLVATDPGLRARLHGAGPSFCSGGDLREFGTVGDPVAAHLIRTTRSAGLALAAVAERVSIRLHGACIGAGIELAAFGGSVTAAPDTAISLPEVAMGLIPGAGGTVSLPRRIGRQRTAWLALTGSRLDAGTAHAWGLVDEVG